MKKVIIGETYFRESDGTYFTPLESHNGGEAYLCRVFEIDEDGNEIDVQTYLVSAHDILRK